MFSNLDGSMIPLSEIYRTGHNIFIQLLLANQVSSELIGFVCCFAFGSNVFGCNLVAFLVTRNAGKRK